MTIDEEIKEIDKAIYKNIDKLDISERGFSSRNILKSLRDFIEHIALKIYIEDLKLILNLDDNYYDFIKKGIKYIKGKGNLKFLWKFHDFLQKSVSHYNPNEEYSERLMLKYYEYLLKTKKFLKTTYNLDILGNLNKFPIKLDSNLKEYYKRISEKILGHKFEKWNEKYNYRFYVHKVKPFFVNNEIYYEIIFSRTRGQANKFDRSIAFTKFEISKNYSVKFSIYRSSINILEKTMPILIIDNWKVAIRQIEISDLAFICGTQIKPSIGKNIEYESVMNFLTTTNFNLLDLVRFEERNYNFYKGEILKNARTSYIFDILDTCRNIIQKNSAGANVLRYSLFWLKHDILKFQKNARSLECSKLSNLKLEWGCIPFDQMPFTTSLIEHNPKFEFLWESLEIEEREHEFLARTIKNNTEKNGNIYTPISNISHFSNILELIDLYNARIYFKHKPDRELEIYNECLYLKGYENDAVAIIRKLQQNCSEGIQGYSDSVNDWLASPNSLIDCDEKKEALIKMFQVSRVALIYGSAGTGKSTLISHISSFFNDYQKLYLANTHPAVDNLRRKVKTSNRTFMTIAKFLNKKVIDSYEVIFIDECSYVSNKDMREILEKAKFSILVLVGDIYQIQSIIFGNWFSLAKKFFDSTSVFELKEPYRARENKHLQTLWNKVRNYDDDILEYIIRNKYSAYLNKSIFQKNDADEIILCLNYDGLYGINNLNKFLQESNPNPSVEWGIKSYKINDPILFNESNTFSPLIYNNLKGKILGIEIVGQKIQFDIEIDKVITQLDAERQNLKWIGNSSNGSRSIIRFLVNKPKLESNDNYDFLDNEVSDIVPFQVAYAVSIHKAQGLEYNSVKIVITDEVDELITHNIFYTAITRAKKNLKIYWSPEIEKKILESFSKKEENKDFYFLTSKYNLK